MCAALKTVSEPLTPPCRPRPGRSAPGRPHRLAALALALASAPTSQAATLCTLSTGGLGFGSYSVADTVGRTSVGQIQITCARAGGPQHMHLTLALGPGQNASSVDQRAMRHQGGSTDRLSYQIYQDATRTLVWGATAGLDAVAITVSVPNKQTVSVTLPMHGFMPAGQDVRPGLYLDALVLTLTP